MIILFMTLGKIAILNREKIWSIHRQYGKDGKYVILKEKKIITIWKSATIDCALLFYSKRLRSFIYSL